jgi:DNA-binding transcriptional MerR regulator
MRIGELSKRAGVHIQTVRFYEREKLLCEPPRSSSGYRIYAEPDLARVRFIRDSQQLGFALKEIKNLLSIHEPDRSGAAPRSSSAARWPEAFRIAEERLALLDKKIAELQTLRTRLAAGLENARVRNYAVCPASSKPAQHRPQTVSKCPAR